MSITQTTIQGFVKANSKKVQTTKDGSKEQIKLGIVEPIKNGTQGLWINVIADVKPGNKIPSVSDIMSSTNEGTFVQATGRLDLEEYGGKTSATLWANSFLPFPGVGGGSSSEPQQQQKQKVVKAGPGVQATRPSDEEFARQLGGHYADMLNEDEIPF